MKPKVSPFHGACSLRVEETCRVANDVAHTLLQETVWQRKMAAYSFKTILRPCSWCDGLADSALTVQEAVLLQLLAWLDKADVTTS